MALFQNEKNNGNLFKEDISLEEKNIQEEKGGETKEDISQKNIDTSVQDNEDNVSNMETDEDNAVSGINLNILKVPIEYFGELIALVQDPDITDIEYNSGSIWTIDFKGNVVKHTELNISENDICTLAERINISKNSDFNNITKTLETDAITSTGESLRIQVLHRDYAQDGTELYIRKTPSFARLNTKEILSHKYATPEELSFLINAIKAHSTVLIAGEPGAGKTEFGKYLSLFIDKDDHAYVIEDTNEWHIKSLRKGLRNTSVIATKDGAGNTRTYAEAIKDSVRCNTNWLMFSEIRGEEVIEYFNALTTIPAGIGTLHAPSAKSIPKKIKNMTKDSSERARLEEEVFLNEIIGVYIQRNASDKSRHINQVVLFSNENNVRLSTEMFRREKFISSTISKSTLARFKRYGIDYPFYCDEVKIACDELGIPFEKKEYELIDKTPVNNPKKEVRI